MSRAGSYSGNSSRWAERYSEALRTEARTLLRRASEYRAGLGAQGLLPGPQRGVGGGLPRRALRGCRAALPGADIQPRLDEQADEQGDGCRQVAVAEFGMGPREELLVEGRADDRYDVAVLGGSDGSLVDGCRRQRFVGCEGPSEGLGRGDQRVHSMLLMLYLVISDRKACCFGSSGS